MKEEKIIEAVYDAAFEYIYSVVPQKRIEDIDVSVSLEEMELIIDIRLVTDRGEEVDQRTVDEAIKYASEKAESILKNE